MDRPELLRLAQMGAAARLEALQIEMNSIYKQFPDLRSKTAAKASAPRRRNRKISAAERRAISVRMKRYWAARRKAKEA
jgi:hypothetical protein